MRLADNAKTVDHILSQIDSRQSPALVQGLIEAVAASRQDATGEKLAARFAQITPASRRLAISVLLRRTAWTAALVDALESSAIGVGDVSDQAWQLLSSHRDANIAERAKKLAGRSIAANSDRQNAKLEHDKALNRVVLELLSDHTELFKQFSDNPNFKRWLTDMVFDATYHPGAKPPAPTQPSASA